jgi:diaminopimelate decarboxylase
MSMMHDWVGAALPEVPPRAQDAERTLFFVNVFTDTELSVQYTKGRAVVKADSISTIAILRDVVNRKARELRVDVNMDTCKLSEAALTRTLQKLDPKVSQSVRQSVRQSVSQSVSRLEDF